MCQSVCLGRDATARHGQLKLSLRSTYLPGSNITRRVSDPIGLDMMQESYDLVLRPCLLGAGMAIENMLELGQETSVDIFDASLLSARLTSASLVDRSTNGRGRSGVSHVSRTGGDA